MKGLKQLPNIWNKTLFLLLSCDIFHVVRSNYRVIVTEWTLYVPQLTNTGWWTGRGLLNVEILSDNGELLLAATTVLYDWGAFWVFWVCICYFFTTLLPLELIINNIYTVTPLKSTKFIIQLCHWVQEHTRFNLFLFLILI